LPVKGLYTYFRYDAKETIICIMNTSDEELSFDAQKDYSERTKGFTSMKNIVTGETLSLSTKIKAKQMIIAKLF
jgi:neopullulanase